MDTRHLEPLAVSPKEAALLTSLSKRKIHELLRRGQIPYRKVGRRTLVLFAGLKDLLR